MNKAPTKMLSIDKENARARVPIRPNIEIIAGYFLIFFFSLIAEIFTMAK